ncbi:MAG: helix-turn-helix domain-containing protein, partial [Clostridiales bacterium]|nr:helix-turn-helix domain-containing protein [Clostridiales bacterium]
GIINDFLLYEIFFSAYKRSCSLYVGETLSELKKNDHDGILTNTIRVYCEQGFKKNETSKKLNIHRNTLEYRLRKIEKHLNFSSENYSDLIQLYIGILIENTYNR